MELDALRARPSFRVEYATGGIMGKFNEALARILAGAVFSGAIFLIVVGAVAVAKQVF